MYGLLPKSSWPGVIMTLFIVMLAIVAIVNRKRIRETLFGKPRSK